MHMEKWLPYEFYGSGTEGNSDRITSSSIPTIWYLCGVCECCIFYGLSKSISYLSHTGTFLEAIGTLMKAYSIHEKTV